MRAQEHLQLLAVLGPRLGRAQARQAKTGPADPECLQQVGQQHDQLGVGLGRGRADRLGPDLPELAVASTLRRLGAEEAREVPELHGLCELAHPVFEVRAAHRRGPLRSQRERPSATVVERVHLLLDDVGRLPDPAREQLGGLERGRLDPPVAGGTEDPLGLLLDDLPLRRRLGQDVECAAGGLNHRALTVPRARAGTDWSRARAQAW